MNLRIGGLCHSCLRPRYQCKGGKDCETVGEARMSKLFPSPTNRHIADLEAENARLRRSGANVSGLLIDAVGTGGEAIADMERERDGYKALAEQRGEALKRARYGLGQAMAFYRIALRRGAHWCSNESEQMDATESALEDVDAALAATPELTNC